MRAELVEKPLLSAVCPWCGSADPPFAGGFCPACHQFREGVDQSAYCALHGGAADPATLVIAPPAPTLVAHGHLCPACGYSFAAAPAVVPAPARRRRRRRMRTLEVALGTLTAVGLVFYGAQRTGDAGSPPAQAASHQAPAAPTPREAISRAYGHDVGPCLLIYHGEGGATYVCSQGDVATIEPGGAVRLPSLF